MSIVIPQVVCAYPAAPAAGLTMMGMSEKRVPPSSLGKRSSARYESCSYGLLQADEVCEQDESGSPTRSMPNITRVRAKIDDMLTALCTVVNARLRSAATLGVLLILCWVLVTGEW